MSGVVEQGVARHLRAWVRGWNRFWFRPADAIVLALVRIGCGLMLLYTHGVWSLELTTFFSPTGVIPEAFVRGQTGGSPFAWSHFYWITSPTVLWAVHIAALVVFIFLTVGLWTRVTSVLAALAVISYANRAAPALFGLDQINGFLSLYLAVGPAGQCLSLDRYLRQRRGRMPTSDYSVSANVSLRLMQCHLCVVYLFAGLGKLVGPTWWSGEAIWMALASYEYQTLDMTWLVHWPWLVSLMTHVTVAWEVSYAFLIWPRLTRPWMLMLAVPLHLGIALCMGMVTFGVIMLIANVAFVRARWIRALLGRWRRLPVADG